MLKKYGIYCENCNVLLNNEDNIFGNNFGHLYHSTCMGSINHGKSTDCQPLMLFKMNLKFADTPTQTTETEREIMELKSSNNVARQSVQQLEAKIKTLEDALLVKDRLKDNVNKLMDCIVRLTNTLSINVVDKAADIVNNTSKGKSNKQSYDENNLNGDDSSLTEAEKIEHNNSHSGVLRSVQQVGARIKALEDALLQTKSDGNKLIECVETLEKNKNVDNAPDDGNNITQDSNANKQANNVSNLSVEQHTADTENVASASVQNHTCTISEEKQEILDLRRNCVLIKDHNRYWNSLDEAFSYVRELANKMNARITDNSIIHIDMDCWSYYVYFRDEDNKKEFLKNRFIYEYNPKTKHYLRILDYTDCGIVNIENFPSSDLSLEKAFVNVLGLAKKMGIQNNRNFIDHIDVYGSKKPNFCKYYVIFNNEYVKKLFLQKKDILKEFPETESLLISDVGGHTSSHHFSKAAVSAIFVGVAIVMGLSLSTVNVQRIYVLNTKKFDNINKDVLISLAVEFYSNDLKKTFLRRNSKLNQVGNIWSSYIDISDIKTEGNIVSIKYYKGPHNVCTAISFIGLAKQLNFKFTPDAFDRFIQLSQFILKTSS